MDDLIGLNDRSLWECLQSCTVDKAEHEGVKRLYCHYMAGVERLKKELVDQKVIMYDFGFGDGIAVGERRAMQRVKEVYAKFACRNKDFCSANRMYCSWCDFGKELGFDGIENSNTEGTDVTSWSDKDDELTTKKDTDNQRYTNGIRTENEK